MNTPFSCACGKVLLLRPENAGQWVRCPSCANSFFAPETLDCPQPIPFPRQAEGDTYALADEDAPRAHPDPAGALPLAEPADEEARPRPRLRRRRRPAPEHLSVPLALLVGFADLLPPSWAYKVAAGMAFLGGIFAVIGVLEVRLTGIASSRPQTLTLAQLASRGPGNNAHVKVTDFITCANYVYVVRVRKFSPSDRHSTKGWEKVYVPLLPKTPALKERMAREPAWHPDAAPGQIRVLLESYRVNREEDLDLLDRKPFIQGTVVNEIKSLDSEARERLEESYPGTDFSKCYVLQEGRKPGSPTRLLFQVAGGTLTFVAGILYGLLVFLFTTRRGE